MPNIDTRNEIKTSIQSFTKKPLSEAATGLLNSLGYSSEKRLQMSLETVDEFLGEFDKRHIFNKDKALAQDWKSIDLLFQITDDEITQAISNQVSLFESKKVDDTIIQSYLFFTLELEKAQYSRTQIAQITREINKLFPMPAMIVFRHGDTITVSIIARRLHKRDESRDVLEKVTLIKDINIQHPHRGHIEILNDLSIDNLAHKFAFTNFVELHRAWQETLDISELNKKFYKEVANWYFWAIKRVTFPEGAGEDVSNRNATSVIRLITRLIFVWFIKEKGLVPDVLFDERILRGLLKYEDPKGSTYYKAILQNLFFATLNTEMGPGRKFRSENEQGRDGHYLITNVYRYKRYIKDPDKAIGYFSGIPFLNGGLFECLDKEAEQDGKRKVIRIDGFSDRDDNPICVPDELFFGSEQTVDLSEDYGDRRHAADKVCGLINIFNKYKFTVEENTPIEEEIALDPELLGKVFENLLASYNPETGTTARKQTGSFYTPREIVNYMVDEALIAYLETKLEGAKKGQERLRHLVSYNNDAHKFNEYETNVLIDAINEIKVLDPACGSGAFPMGGLHKLVYILGKLDEDNRRWQQRQLEKAIQDTEAAYKIGDQEERRQRLMDIEDAFENNTSNYGRKLFLIQNCIFGVDIQPIAVQISKLRFFISLIVDQKVEIGKPNFGIRPLPNLESKFVAADTLIGIERPHQLLIRNPEIETKEKNLSDIRAKLFVARTTETKQKYRNLDKQLRDEIADLLETDGWDTVNALKISSWDPFDQNISASFFDPMWMFGLSHGFNIIIGNPPYIQLQKDNGKLANFYSPLNYHTFDRTGDIYCLFYEKGLNLLQTEGVLCYITSNKWMRSVYGGKLRSLFVKFNPLKLIDLGPNVFESAMVDTSIFLIKNCDDFKYLEGTTVKDDLETIDNFSNYIELHQNFIENLSESPWFIGTKAEHALMNKIVEKCKPLNEWNVKINLGIKTGHTEAFIVTKEKVNTFAGEDQKIFEIIKPILRGRDIRRYSYNHADLFLLHTGFDIDVPNNYPVIYQHLMQFGPKIMKRADQGLNWYNLRACTYYDDFRQPKIVWPDIATEPSFAWVSEGIYISNTAYMISGGNKALLGILNSRVVEWIFPKIASDLGDGGSRYFKEFVEMIPIPDFGDKENPLLQQIEVLVEKMLLVSNKEDCLDENLEIPSLEEKINSIVYKLYDLSHRDISIIEEQTYPRIKLKVRDFDNRIVEDVGNKNITQTIQHDQPILSDYSIYKCGLCGKLVIGYDKEKHANEFHQGKTDWSKLR